MADDDNPRIITPMPKELLASIDDYRFTKRLPSRSAAIRQLIEIGLKTERADAGEIPATHDRRPR